ncbi:MAG: PilZ domain-containing protein [Alphaproteobacteria bacterium]|nr:PilZ domain-containing protein [Alphaproteobacteria bacterium]
MTDEPPQTDVHGVPRELVKRRAAVRLTTVYGGRVIQFGKAYPCVVSDVSAGGAKVRLKDPRDFSKLTKSQPVELVFERLSDYKSLGAEIAWTKPDEDVVGLTFTDPELRRRVVIKKLMPNRWRIATEHVQAEAEGLEGDGA